MPFPFPDKRAMLPFTTMAAKPNSLSLYNVLLVLIVAAAGICAGTKDIYIVYMGSLPDGEYSPKSYYLNVLEETLGDSGSANEALVTTYGRSFNAFSARLNDEEQQLVNSNKQVINVFKSRNLQLQTTSSWDFMGLTKTVKRQPTAERDVIVGVIDSGIWPEAESFNDEGYGPPPMRWKGTCAGGKNFTCNNKIIGARVYSQITSARDIQGHGTHTASTVVGNNIAGGSFYGIATGDIRGGVPKARIAVYKVCSLQGCSDNDILAAFDDAIADGVDIITISIGGQPVNFEADSIAIGSFHALEKRIITVQSAGNTGPEPSSVASLAPWLFSVAASSTDRRITNKVVLGNGKTIIGNAVNAFTINRTKIPLVYGQKASSKCSASFARLCSEECLDPKLVKGKIVVCDGPQGWKEASRAGARGSITLDGVRKDVALVVSLPSSALTIDKHNAVKAYVRSTPNPQGSILKSSCIKDAAAPVVASFSSRGPNSIVAELLKPDISAPGVDILAAYSPLGSLSTDPNDKRSAKYNILSGTSMACPHVAAAVAYVKSFHPNWSPSVIKSALMTTARPMNATKPAADATADEIYAEGEFAFGVGHVNPVKAITPGLVYRANKADYVQMLCSMQVRFFGACPKNVTGSPKDLNYPSMQAQVDTDKSFKLTFPRSVINVGFANSTYTSKIVSDPTLKVSVQPATLSFKSYNEMKSFVVTVSGKGLPATKRVSASLVWSDGTHSVRSPIVVYTVDDISP